MRSLFPLISSLRIPTDDHLGNLSVRQRWRKGHVVPLTAIMASLAESCLKCWLRTDMANQIAALEPAIIFVTFQWNDRKVLQWHFKCVEQLAHSFYLVPSCTGTGQYKFKLDYQSVRNTRKDVPTSHSKKRDLTGTDTARTRQELITVSRLPLMKGKA